MSDNNLVDLIGDEAESENAETLLKRLGVEPTPDRIQALVQFIQNNTTIHARESDPYLPDADNAARWNDIVPGSATRVIDLITDVVRGNRDDNAKLNDVRRKNESGGFQVARIIALACVPVAIGASLLGIPTTLCVTIVVMGIGGPTAASFFGNWAGKSQEQ